MSLVSFPHMTRDDNDSGSSLYSKMYSAASNMFHSLLNEDGKQDDHRNVRTPRSPASVNKSDAIKDTRDQHVLSQVIDNSSSQRSTSDTVNRVAPSQEGEAGLKEHEEANTADRRDLSRPPLMRSSTTSTATVEVSSAQAIPLLPSTYTSLSTDVEPDEPSDSFSLSSRSVYDSGSIYGGKGSTGQAFDVGSVTSISSISASRAYLASQYSRSRSRASQGRLGREFWMKDDSASSCFSCNRPFTTFRRKHHCRVCGQIFCSSCTRLIDCDRYGASVRRVRCCKSCEEALAAHSSSEDEADLSIQSHAYDDTNRVFDPLIEDSRLETITNNGYLGSINSMKQGSEMDKPSTDARSDEGYTRLPSPADADDMHYARSFLLGPHSSHISRSRSRSVSRSLNVLQAVKDEEISHSPSSRSQNLGAPAAALNTTVHTNTSTGTGNTLSGNTINSQAVVTTTASPNTTGNHFHGYNSTSTFHTEDFPLSSAKFPNSASVELNNASLTYLQLFLDQLLKDSDLDTDEWHSVLMAPLLEVAAGLHLEINDRISPREWVKIKRIPGGSPEDIDCINGTVFTHSVARRSMPRKIFRPRILFIRFPIEYARNEKYISLEPVVAQEREYLRKLVARIVALRPNLLLTCSHVCGQAMDMLEAAGVSVAQNIRESALFRLSKITRGDILISMDRLNAVPQLGTCELFEERTYRYESLAKTFLFFFVQKADPGRCALIRGEPEISSVVKVVMEVMAEICYSLKAETALMRDQFVIVPSLDSPPKLILSSSPFVDYGQPYLQHESLRLEDEVVSLGNRIGEAQTTDEKYILTKKLDFVRFQWLRTSREWEMIELNYPFLFNPSSHQNLMVLYSLVCSQTATPCIGPDSQLIEFYLHTDQTLGKFVESSIIQVSAPCPDGCEHTVGEHYRTYVNGNGMVSIYTEKLACKVPGLEESILMWSYCKQCQQQMPVVPMSSTTWKCSMGKYLELSFYGEPLKMRASSCKHNVYRDHLRYFGWHGYAVKIEYSMIELHEINGPPNLLQWNPEKEVELKRQSYNDWSRKLNRFWNSVLDSLSNVKIEGLEESMIHSSHQRLTDLKEKAERDKAECLNLLDQKFEESPPYDYLSLNGVLEEYQQMVDQWHTDFADFDSQYFPTERDIRRVTAQHIRGLLGDDIEKPKSVRRPSDVLQDNKVTDGDNGKETSEAAETEKLQVDGSVAVAKDMTDLSRSAPSKHSEFGDLLGSDGKTPDLGANLKEAVNSVDKSVGSPSPSSIKAKSKSGNDIDVLMPGLNKTNIKGGRVAMLAKHFEELSREFEKERQKEQKRLQQRQKAIQMRHAHPVAEVFEDVSEAIEDWPLPGSRSQHSRSKSVQHQIEPVSTEEALCPHEDRLKPKASTQQSASDKPAQTCSHLVNDDGDLTRIASLGDLSKDKPKALVANEDSNEIEETKKTEPAKLSLISTLANFWAERSSTRWNGIEYALSTEQHHFTNSLVVIRETEPSSLIAFCLSLPDYRSRVEGFYGAKGTDIQSAIGKGAQGNPSSIMTESNRTTSDGTLEEVMLRQTGTHMRYHIDKNTVKVSCKIFFSEQFDAMRRKCTDSQKYIQSLSRCTPWESTGGKSGSSFLKTQDDRLILKELSHAEFDSFVTFAPSYFEYISQALFHDLPTVLAKILGVYQITIRNSQTSQQVKMYVLVMENLFYGSKFTKFFDLKGSMRNRKVTETGKENEVLLDENMVEFIYETPVFVREHAKRMLRTSLYNDTLFLTKMNVMDYSLVIGLNDSDNTIAAGIIDYIRTYTWDKKIESWVKTRAATVGIKEPTVVSPKQYKGRFRESMERYFVMVPDCWTQQGV